MIPGCGSNTTVSANASWIGPRVSTSMPSSLPAVGTVCAVAMPVPSVTPALITSAAPHLANQCLFKFMITSSGFQFTNRRNPRPMDSFFPQRDRSDDDSRTAKPERPGAANPSPETTNAAESAGKQIRPVDLHLPFFRGILGIPISLRMTTRPFTPGFLPKLPPFAVVRARDLPVLQHGAHVGPGQFPKLSCRGRASTGCIVQRVPVPVPAFHGAIPGSALSAANELFRTSGGRRRCGEGHRSSNQLAP